MQERDKKGRFVKKGNSGLKFTRNTLNGLIYTNDGGTTWYSDSNYTIPYFGNVGTSTTSLLIEPTYFNQMDEDPEDKAYDALSEEDLKRFAIPLTGKEYDGSVDMAELINQAYHNKRLNPYLSINTETNGSYTSTTTNGSYGQTFVDPPKEKDSKLGEYLLGALLNPTTFANIAEAARAYIGTKTNNKIAERALKAEKPFLQDISETHHTIYGDYRAQIQGEKAAAQLRNLASIPITSDLSTYQSNLMDAQIKGQEYINLGNAADEAMINKTKELAWAEEKANALNRAAISNANRQAMLMTLKNKAQIENARDSANFSLIISPLLMGQEQRLRNKGSKYEYWLDYYNDALAAQNVWSTYTDGLTDTQKMLAQKYLTEGYSGIESWIGTDTNRELEWLLLSRIMSQEVLKQQAANRGVYLNIPNSNYDPKNLFNYKKGGTIYRARLTKRTRDNDRAARSIESNKKIAARFLEKAIDSLYTYKDIELIAKPVKKSRKYLAGGGLPFVGFTPVFATSETGAPATKAEESKDDDITSKDILSLLKDLDGLPSDIDAIQASLSNFVLTSKLDPLGLDSTSSIASRYMSLIGKIKKAKANKEWYDKAYDKLRTDGSLNEYAIDSTGHFIGMNVEGDFERFTAQQVANGEVGDYLLLTNGNLLDIRARYPNAAFNSNLIMEAANGISMQQVTEHISKVIQNLGSETTQTLIFGNQSKEVIAGLRQLQQAAQEIGQDLSISQLYEASVFNKTQAQQAQLALSYLYQTMPTNMRALLFAKAGSELGALDLVQTLVNSKLSSTHKLEFSPKTQGKSSNKSGKTSSDGLDLSPAQMLLQGYGERESILIQNSSSGGIHVDAITMPITTGSTGEPLGAATLEDVATSQYGGLLNFNHASMGGQIIPFEGRRNIAIDGSKISSMYLPIDLDELIKGNIVPDIDLIDKVNLVNKIIKQHNITDPKEINAKYEEAGLPVYLNEDGTVIPTLYRRFGVLNGTALDNAFGKDFVTSSYLKEVDDEDIINGAISIMNKGRSKEDKIDYDPKSFFNFGGLLGDYDSIYLGTIFIPMSNDVFLGIAGSGKTVDSEEALQLEALQQQHDRVRETYKNPGQLR